MNTSFPIFYSVGRRRSSVSQGFTLVELLTVVAIVGVLLAIVFSVLGRVRAQARQSTCLSNLRQIAIGVQLYANDSANGRRLPPKVKDANAGWHDSEWFPQLLQPYLDAPDVWNCPAQSEDRHLGYDRSNPWRAKNAWRIPSYAMNSNLAGKRLIDVTNGSHLGLNQILFLDGKDSFWDQASINKTSSPYVETIHDDKTNALFVDGHVSVTRREDLLVQTNPQWSYGSSVPQRLVTVRR